MGSTTIEPLLAEIAGIPTERLSPMRDGSVREYDRPVFTEEEGVGRFQDPEAVRLHVHPPGSEVAEALRPILEGRNEQRRAMGNDAYMQEFAAEIKRCERAERKRLDSAVRAWRLEARNHGRAPARTATRTRGAGRPKASATRSSARSGDSGSDDSESSEPPRRRLCAYCGKVLPPKKRKYCTDKHAANDRKRRQRERDRARSKLPPAAQPADYWRMREITDRDRKQLWELAVCRCNGRHIELEPGWCTKCGHWLPDNHPLKDGAQRYAAFARRLAEPTVVQRLVERYREQVAA